MVMDYVLGLGSNLGSRMGHLSAGIELLGGNCDVLAVSPVYESAGVGPPQPAYLNGAVRIASPESPRDLLTRLLSIEATLGRDRTREQRWGPRTLDLDILWAPEACDDTGLTIPHARLRERWFALRPLLDVAPELEPEYLPALAALPDAPSQPWLVASSVAIAEFADGLEIEASALDRCEALAQAITSLGRRLFPGTPASSCTRPLVLAGTCLPGAESAAFVSAVLDAIAGGRAFARATLAELGPGSYRGRLLFAEERPRGTRRWRLDAATSCFASTALRIVLRNEAAG
jgi:2-amino-4-hydroxy-6-hydroxymethyldihydropteridine diphosphokinase